MEFFGIDVGSLLGGKSPEASSAPLVQPDTYSSELDRAPHVSPGGFTARSLEEVHADTDSRLRAKWGPGMQGMSQSRKDEIINEGLTARGLPPVTRT